MRRVFAEQVEIATRPDNFGAIGLIEFLELMRVVLFQLPFLQMLNWLGLGSGRRAPAQLRKRRGWQSGRKGWGSRCIGEQIGSGQISARTHPD